MLPTSNHLSDSRAGPSGCNELNRKIILRRRPVGMPALADFAHVADSIPALQQGEFLVEARWLSADPLQRWRMDEVAVQGGTIALGETVWGRMAGQILCSRHERWQEGDFVEGMLGWQTHPVSRGETGRAGYAPGVIRVDPAAGPLSTALGVLGMPGLTAYCALHGICRPRSGETVVVSAAAGTVGSIAGQLASALGCRVVGIAGGPEKARHLLEDLGFDAAIDYKSSGDLFEALRSACPDGVDAYFDNVGGPVADAVLRVLSKGARVAIVGRVAQLTGHRLREDRQDALIGGRVRLEGFIVYDHVARFQEAREAIGALLRAGRLRYFETVHHGFASAPQALIDVLQGQGIGKHLIAVEAKT